VNTKPLTAIRVCAVENFGDQITVVRIVTVEHMPDVLHHEERTVLRVGACDVLDLVSATVAHPTVWPASP
jgi:hypothetical protein